jgi:hypothetical protein
MADMALGMMTDSQRRRFFDVLKPLLKDMLALQQRWREAVEAQDR